MNEKLLKWLFDIHGYDRISDENIWGILIKHLPQLKMEVYQLIEKEGKGS